METYFDANGRVQYRKIGSGGGNVKNHDDDTRIRYHEKYHLGCIKMTRWQWTTIILLVLSWLFVIGYMYITYYHMGVTHADRMGQMMEAAESNAIPGMPGWLAAIGIQYMSRQAGMDGSTCHDQEACQTNDKQFAEWYNNHMDRTMQRYSTLYNEYGVKHPYETAANVKRK